MVNLLNEKKKENFNEERQRRERGEAKKQTKKTQAEYEAAWSSCCRGLLKNESKAQRLS